MDDFDIDPTDINALFNLVQDNINGNATDEEKAWLRAHPQEWYVGLTAVVKDVERQSSFKGADVKALQFASAGEDAGPGDPAWEKWQEAVADFQEWKRRASHFKNMVDAQSRIVKKLNHTAHDRAYAEHLRQAIQRHQRASLREGGVPSEADLELWEATGQKPEGWS